MNRNIDKELTYEEVLARGLKLEESDKFAVRDIAHPLLNKESKHYSMFDGTEAIKVLELLMNREELMAWCKGNIFKYRLRIGNKGCVESDAKKIATYEAYYKYLEGGR